MLFDGEEDVSRERDALWSKVNSWLVEHTQMPIPLELTLFVPPDHISPTGDMYFVLDSGSHLGLPIDRFAAIIKWLGFTVEQVNDIILNPLFSTDGLDVSLPFLHIVSVNFVKEEIGWYFVTQKAIPNAFLANCLNLVGADLSTHNNILLDVFSPMRISDVMRNKAVFIGVTTDMGLNITPEVKYYFDYPALTSDEIASLESICNIDIEEQANEYDLPLEQLSLIAYTLHNNEMTASKSYWRWGGRA